MSEVFRRENERDLARLRFLLDRALRHGDVPTDRKEKGPSVQMGSETRILDLACGACHEAEVLVDAVAALKQTEPASKSGLIKLTGVDVRAREIADAQRRFGGKREIGKSEIEGEFEFLTGDASRLDQHRSLESDFDLVFMRHQNYWNGARVWDEIYDQALTKLDEEGRLVITSYFDKEHELALKAIQRLGGELIHTEFNPDGRGLPTPGKTVDRHVAVFRRAKT